MFESRYEGEGREIEGKVLEGKERKERCFITNLFGYEGMGEKY